MRFLSYFPNVPRRVPYKKAESRHSLRVFSVFARLKQFFSISGSPKTSIRVPEKYGLGELPMVLRVAYLIGVKDRQRRYFWELLLGLKASPETAGQGLLYGIMIYQMHQTYRHIDREVRRQNSDLFAVAPAPAAEFVAG